MKPLCLLLTPLFIALLLSVCAPAQVPASQPCSETDGIPPQCAPNVNNWLPAVQRLIVAQINQGGGEPPVDYAGDLSYDVAPWVDWGPYLWASGENLNGAGIRWCNGQGDPQCGQNFDVRFGDLADQEDFWGDYTHPTAHGAGVVADQLVRFIQGNLTSVQHNISDWVVPWIRKP